jgi:hypothetical protein
MAKKHATEKKPRPMLPSEIPPSKPPIMKEGLTTTRRAKERRMMLSEFEAISSFLDKLFNYGSSK